MNNICSAKSGTIYTYKYVLYTKYRNSVEVTFSYSSSLISKSVALFTKIRNYSPNFFT